MPAEQLFTQIWRLKNSFQPSVYKNYYYYIPNDAGSPVFDKSLTAEAYVT